MNDLDWDELDRRVEEIALALEIEEERNEIGWFRGYPDVQLENFQGGPVWDYWNKRWILPASFPSSK